MIMCGKHLKLGGCLIKRSNCPRLTLASRRGGGGGAQTAPCGGNDAVNALDRTKGNSGGTNTFIDRLTAEAAFFVVPSRGRLFCLHVPAAHLISELRNHVPDGFVVSVTSHVMTVRKCEEAGVGGATLSLMDHITVEFMH